jgi:molybdenum cofactor guanylyltransferase
MATRDRVSLGILAGGRGSRLGGADKAFLQLPSGTLLGRVLAAAGTGFADVLVSHNRLDDPRRLRFEQAGVRFVADADSAGQGPLAGLGAMLEVARGGWLLSLPVDLAAPSSEMVESLLATQGAVLHDADGLQPLVALWPVFEAQQAVREALASGQLAVHDVVARLGIPTIDITPRRLGNLNTPDDLRRLA